MEKELRENTSLTKEQIRIDLESHDYGNIIYYKNVLIKSKRQGLNEFSTYDEWVEHIHNNPNFCGCQYHDNMSSHCSPLTDGL